MAWDGPPAVYNFSRELEPRNCPSGSYFWCRNGIRVPGCELNASLGTPPPCPAGQRVQCDWSEKRRAFGEVRGGGREDWRLRLAHVRKHFLSLHLTVRLRPPIFTAFPSSVSLRLHFSCAVGIENAGFYFGQSKIFSERWGGGSIPVCWISECWGQLSPVRPPRPESL